MTKTKSKGILIKESLICAVTGVGVSFGASLFTAWIAMQTKDPVSLAGTMGAVCALCGALTAALFGSIKTKDALGGACACGLYTVICILMSLCLPETTGSPLIQIGVSLLGGLGGVAFTRGSRKKSVRKYTKKRL